MDKNLVKLRNIIKDKYFDFSFDVELNGDTYRVSREDGSECKVEWLLNGHEMTVAEGPFNGAMVINLVVGNDATKVVSGHYHDCHFEAVSGRWHYFDYGCWSTAA